MPMKGNSFTCSNGHTFNAIAKLRARCPECGLSTRRSFTATPTTDTGRQSPSTSSSSFVRKVVKKINSDNGSKPVSTSTKEKPLESETKPSAKPEVSKPTSIQVIKQGNMPRAKAKIPEKSVVKGPTKRVRAAVGSHPSVTVKPTGSRERKTLKTIAETAEIPFWQKVQKRYGINR